MKSARHLSFRGADAPHGTRVRYVAGKCRCEECRRANREYYHARMAKRRELEDEVVPTAPPLDGTLIRGGRTYRVKRCAGANGAACVTSGGAWLRERKLACADCIERATVWNGLVSAEPARKHLLALRRAGVGYKSVAAASDVSKTLLTNILNRSVTQIRARSERRILNVDNSALADGAIVSAAKANKIIAKMRARGLSGPEIGRLLGYESGQTVQLGKKKTMLLGTRARIERVWRKLQSERLAKAAAERPSRTFDNDRPPPPDMIPHEWLDDDGVVLPQWRDAAARLKAQARRAVRDAA